MRHKREEPIMCRVGNSSLTPINGCQTLRVLRGELKGMDSYDKFIIGLDLIVARIIAGGGYPT